MACELTTGFTLDCRDSVGGIKSIRVAALGDFTVDTEASGEITGITATNGFYEYELRKQTSNFTESITSSDENGTLFYEQELSVMLSKMEAAKRNELLLVAKNLIAVIVEDQNGKYWMLGQNNGLTLGGSANTGTAMGDRNGYELTFTGQEEDPAKEVDSGIIAGITA